MKYAFRCLGKMRDGSECGHLVSAEHAGQLKAPGHCPVCKCGVEFDSIDANARAALRTEMITAAKADDVAKVDALMRQLHTMPLKKTFKPDNWEVLGDATSERLEELGIKSEEVEKHLPFKTVWKHNTETKTHEPTHTPLELAEVPNGSGQHHERSVVDFPGTSDNV